MTYALFFLLAVASNLVVVAEETDQICQGITASNTKAVQVADGHIKIDWQGGSTNLMDDPNDDHPLVGTYYEYCDYYPEVKLHHITMAVDDVFTGILLSDETGKVLDAGQVVLFDSTYSRYFTSRQPNGLDGEEWLLYSIDGKQLWQGYSGVSAIDEKTGVTYFETILFAPWFDMQGDLNARGACFQDYWSNNAEHNARHLRHLLKITDGDQSWSPRLICTESATQDWFVEYIKHDFYLNNGKGQYKIDFDVGTPRYLGTLHLNDNFTLVVYRSGDVGTSVIIRIERALLFNNGRYVANVPYSYIDLRDNESLGPEWTITDNEIIIDDKELGKVLTFNHQAENEESKANER